MNKKKGIIIAAAVALVLVALSVVAGLNSVTQDLSQAMRIWRVVFVFAAWCAGLLGACRRRSSETRRQAACLTLRKR